MREHILKRDKQLLREAPKLRDSLVFQLNAPIIFISIVMIGFIILTTNLTGKRLLAQHVENNLDTISDALVVALESHSSRNIQRIVSAMAARHNVAHLSITRSIDHTIIADNIIQHIGKTADHSWNPQENQLLNQYLKNPKKNHTLEHDGIQYALRETFLLDTTTNKLNVYVIMLSLDQALFSHTLKHEGSLLITIITTSLLFLIAAAAMAQHRKLILPLRTSIRQMQRYNKDAPLNIPITSNNELGNLALIFNRLSLEKFERETKIAQMNKNLISYSQNLMNKSKKLEEETIRANQASKDKSNFVATMSHEVRTPLNGLMGMLRILEKTPLNPTQKRHIKLANTSANHLLDIVNSILDISRIEANKMTLEYVDFDMASLINDVANTLSPGIAERPITIIKDFDGSIEIPVRGDIVRIRQIYLNLLSNAIKFTENGTITIGAKIISEDSKGLHVSGFVSDTGIGIPLEKQNKIFESFTQADESTARVYGGSGLGLSLVKRLCDLMQGTITVTSEVNKGTKFYFNLHLAKPEQNDAEPTCNPDNTQKERSNIYFYPSTNSTKDAAFQRNPKKEGACSRSESTRGVESKKESAHKILLIEDNAINREVVLGLLEEYPLIVDVAANGKEAIEKLKSSSTPYHLILMDCDMPEMDGYACSKIIRTSAEMKTHRHTPIIAMTANTMRDDKNKCINAGMDDFIAKPIYPETMMTAIERWLNKGVAMGLGGMGNKET